MEKEMSDRDTVRSALYDAIEWQRSILSAYADARDDPEVARTVARLKKYRAVLMRRYGEDADADRRNLDTLPTMSVFPPLPTQGKE
jgi:hypothetical protein